MVITIKRIHPSTVRANTFAQLRNSTKEGFVGEHKVMRTNALRVHAVNNILLPFERMLLFLHLFAYLFSILFAILKHSKGSITIQAE